MKIAEIKTQMKNYKDFFGGDLLNVDDIDNCKTKKQLGEILLKHSRHMDDMENDAQRDLTSFRRKLGLEYL